MSRKKSAFHKSINDVSQMNKYVLYDDISLLAKGRFKWSNLPKGVTSKNIEKLLFEHGQLAFYFDEKIGYKCLPCSDTGMVNIYGESLEVNITSLNHESEFKKVDEVVKILANDNGTANRIKVLYYCDYLNEIEDTMRVNLGQQKFPYIIPTTEKTKLSLKNLYEQIKEGVQAIFVDERLNAGGDDSIKVLKTDAPFLLHDLQKHKNDILNEMYSWLGVNNTKFKQERMLVDEVNVNNSYIQMNLENEYRLRKLACDEINEKFGLNIIVEKTIDLLEVSFKGDESETETNDKKFKLF